MDNFSQLNYLYDEMLNNVKKVSVLIDEGRYEEIQSYLDMRDAILQHIKAVRSELKVDLSEELIFKAECIKEVEAANIKRLEALREEVSANIKKTRGKEMLMKKYTSSFKETGALLDFRR